MNLDLANLSADLRRVSYWLCQNQVDLAKRFLKQTRSRYRNIEPKVGCYQNIWEEIERIADLGGGFLRASERALTASLILMHSSERRKGLEPLTFSLPARNAKNK